MSAFYNRVLAAGYAAKYALQNNQAWIKDIEDCTNFVSQALYFGGWPMTAGDGNDSVTAWYNISDPDSIFGQNWGRSSYRRSRTWGAAENFRQFLLFGGRAQKCAIDKLTMGDVVQHFVDGSGVPLDDDHRLCAEQPEQPGNAWFEGQGSAGVLSLERQIKHASNLAQLAVRKPFLEDFGPCARHLELFGRNIGGQDRQKLVPLGGPEAFLTSHAVSRPLCANCNVG